MARKFGKGEQVRIADFEHGNWQDAGEAHRQSKSGPVFGPGGELTIPDSNEGIVLVKLPRDLPQFSVLGLRGSIPDPNYSTQQLIEFKNQVALRGEIPSSETIGRFGVLQVSGVQNEIVPAMVSGVTQCRLNVTSLADEFAEIDPTAVDPTRLLKTGGSGSAQIMFRPEQLGEQWGVVRLGNRTGKQIVLAKFTSHVSPSTPYSYPSRTASTQDRVFPAYIQRGVTWVDNPSLPGWSVTQVYNYTGEREEPVFVYSLRFNYIPSTSYLLPIFEHNGLWYCDYVRPYNQVKIYGAGSALGTSPSTLTGGTCDNGVGFQAEHPFSYDSGTGLITFHRACRASIHVNLVLENNASPTGEYYVQSGFDGGAATAGTNAGYAYFPASVGTGLRTSLHWQDCWDVGAGLTTSIVAQMNSTSGGRACNLFGWTITIETRDALI